MSIRVLGGLLCVATLALLTACASRTRRVAAPAGALKPTLDASRQQLIERYDRQAGDLESLNAAVKITAETGSAFAGVIKDYRQISAFVLAERPAYIRVVGQAPVVSNDIFDMVSDGNTFRMYIPSKRKFLVGPARLAQAGRNSMENLRPQPIFDALLWRKIQRDETVVQEEEDRDQPPSRDYVLSVLRRANGQLELDRRIWFDRSDLQVSRVEIFGSGGRLESDIRYSDWREQTGQPAFPRRILLRRPHEDYRLEIDVTRVTANASLPPGRFRLEQPAGTERVEVGGMGGQP